MSDLSIELSNEQLHRIAKAIAEPQRLAILTCIARTDEIACKQVVMEFSITQATISHHLKELVAAELIHVRREGQLAYLCCRREVCDAYTQTLVERLVEPGKLMRAEPS